MNNLALWIGIIGGAIGICTALAGISASWAASVQKKYASQRDFEHLKNNQRQISEAVANIDKDMDDLKQTMHAIHTLTMHIPEIKAFILAKLPDTQGWMQK